MILVVPLRRKLQSSNSALHEGLENVKGSPISRYGKFVNILLKMKAKTQHRQTQHKAKTQFCFFSSVFSTLLHRDESLVKCYR